MATKYFGGRYMSRADQRLAATAPFDPQHPFGEKPRPGMVVATIK